MLGEKLLAESGRIEQLSRGILWFSRPGEEPTSALSVKKLWRIGGDSNPRKRFNPLQHISSVPLSTTQPPVRMLLFMLVRGYS